MSRVVSRTRTRRNSRIGALISSAPMTFARTGPAYLDGTEYASGVPRYPSNSGVRGVLVEESSTNIVTYSDPTALNGTTTYTTSNVVAAAFGAPFSGGVAFGDNSVIRYWYPAKAALAASTLYVMSVYVKMDDGGAPVSGETSSAGDFSMVLNNAVRPATVTEIGGGLYRVDASVTTGATPSVNWGVQKYTGQSARTFKTTGIQIEAKGYMTQHIPTAGATVTRNAETLTIPTAGLLVPSQGSVIIRAYYSAQHLAALTSFFTLFGHGTAGTVNNIILRRSNANKIQAVVRNAASTTQTAEVNAPTVAGWHHFGVRYSPTALSAWLNGAKGETVAAMPVPQALGTCTIGSDAFNGLQWDSAIAAVYIYDHALSDAEMAAATLGNPPPDFTAHLDFTSGQLKVNQGHPWELAESLNLLLDAPTVGPK